MALKKDKAKKKKPRAKKRMTGLVILDGKRQIDRRTGLNRDIPPMGGGGGSPNLLQALATRPAITGQGGFSIQTPDQFKQAQDISTIAEEVKKQRISIGEPTKLSGKIIDLTDVEAQKKSPIKMEPNMPSPSTPSPMTKVPFGKSMSQYEEMLVKQARLEKAEDEARRTMRSRMQPAQSAGGASREAFVPYVYGTPRQWLGGGHVAGLAPASAPSSIVGDADAMGAPQPDTY
jgi:hypothetical protein